LVVNIVDMFYIGIMSPPRRFPVKKVLALSQEMADAISNYRFESRALTELDAIRRLIELGLGAVKSEGPAREA
jgi:hypothetical protein